MGYETEIDRGFGFDLGDILTYGYGQGPLWSTTLEHHATEESFKALIRSDYDLLEARFGGDSTMESVVHLVARDTLEAPSPEALAQLWEFADRYALEEEPSWMDWVNRF